MSLFVCSCARVSSQLNDDLFIRSEDWMPCPLASIPWALSPEPPSIWYAADKNNLHFTIWWVTVSFKYAGFSHGRLFILDFAFFFFIHRFRTHYLWVVKHESQIVDDFSGNRTDIGCLIEWNVLTPCLLNTDILLHIIYIFWYSVHCMDSMRGGNQCIKFSNGKTDSENSPISDYNHNRLERR